MTVWAQNLARATPFLTHRFLDADTTHTADQFHESRPVSVFCWLRREGMGNVKSRICKIIAWNDSLLTTRMPRWTRKTDDSTSLRNSIFSGGLSLPKLGFEAVMFWLGPRVMISFEPPSVEHS